MSDQFRVIDGGGPEAPQPNNEAQRQAKETFDSALDRAEAILHGWADDQVNLSELLLTSSFILNTVLQELKRRAGLGDEFRKAVASSKQIVDYDGLLKASPDQ